MTQFKLKEIATKVIKENVPRIKKESVVEFLRFQ